MAKTKKLVIKVEVEVSESEARMFDSKNDWEGIEIDQAEFVKDALRGGVGSSTSIDWELK